MPPYEDDIEVQGGDGDVVDVGMGEISIEDGCAGASPEEDHQAYLCIREHDEDLEDDATDVNDTIIT